MCVSRKKITMKFVFGKDINIEVFYIFAISPERMGDDVDFFPVNKLENFLQVNSITLGVQSQACPRYPKQVYKILALSQGKCEECS